MIILGPFMRDNRRRQASPLSKCSMFCSINSAALQASLSVGVEMGKGTTGSNSTLVHRSPQLCAAAMASSNFSGGSPGTVSDERI